MILNKLRNIPTHVFLAIVALAMVVCLSTVGLLTVNQTITSNGSIKSINVAVYSDSACTTALSSLSWGIVSPGTSLTKTIYIKNTGNSPLTLSTQAQNWIPTGVNNSITLTCNKENTVINPGSSISADLTLTVSSGIGGITTFSVDIIIIGTA
jgi:hypothetical protein